jgi:hypothetical protein
MNPRRDRDSRACLYYDEDFYYPDLTINLHALITKCDHHKIVHCDVPFRTYVQHNHRNCGHLSIGKLIVRS